MIITYNGQSYEITNWEEFCHGLLEAIGTEIDNEAIRSIKKMKLFDTGRFMGSTGHKVEGNSLVIYNSAPYAVYLEYGTLEYWRLYGQDKYTEPLHPKKKNMTSEERSKYPKGMQPFAVYRRILYNPEKLAQIIKRALGTASRAG